MRSTSIFFLLPHVSWAIADSETSGTWSSDNLVIFEYTSDNFRTQTIGLHKPWWPSHRMVVRGSNRSGKSIHLFPFIVNFSEKVSGWRYLLHYTFGRNFIFTYLTSLQGLDVCMYQSIGIFDWSTQDPFFMTMFINGVCFLPIFILG